MLTMGMDFNYQAAHAWFLNLDRQVLCVSYQDIKRGSERTEREKALSRLRSRLLGGYVPSAGSANSENFTRK